jgi:hypothetical protein
VTTTEVDLAGDPVHAQVDFHRVGEAFREAVLPLVALLGLVHLRIPLALLVLGGTGRSDPGGVHDRALAHRYASFTEMGFDGLKNQLAQLVLLQQVAEGEDRGFVRDLSLISSMSAKRRIVSTTISASSMAGSLREYRYCNRCIRSMLASG